MEHRWGTRRPLGVDVKVCVQPGVAIKGRLLNASSSGGYVATSARVPIMTRVYVTLGCDRLQRGNRQGIAAHVVRSESRGIGFEWQDFAPSPVLALIDALKPAPAVVDHSVWIDSLSGISIDPQSWGEAFRPAAPPP